jgi:hypothetical protein
MSHVKPFIIVGIDAFGDVGIAGWGQGEEQEQDRLDEYRRLYPEKARLTVVYLQKEKDLVLLRRLQAEGAARNEDGTAEEGWE